MNTFLSMIKKFPWWVWVGIIVAIIVIWQISTAGAMANKLFKMALDNLRQDQSKVVKTLEENQKMYETEIGKLIDQVQDLKQKQAAAAAESQRLKGMIGEKDVEITRLRKERESIVVSGDPDSLVNDLHKMGYKSARKRINPPR